MPPGFTIVGEKADFLIPYGQTMEQFRAARGRGNSYAIARLREGVSFEQAFSGYHRIGAERDLARLFATAPEEAGVSGADLDFVVARLEDAWERLESEIERADELAYRLSFHQLWGRFLEAVHGARPSGKRAHRHAGR